MVAKQEPTADPPSAQVALLNHFCRLQAPEIALPAAVLDHHLRRTFAIHRAKQPLQAGWPGYLDSLHVLDWFVACACLEGRPRAWERLFAARASRGDCLLIDALRSRAARLYPRDEERQEGAVAEFWSHLLVAETSDSVPVLARYDGQRPLVPWLIRVFQNWHVSQLRHHAGRQSFPEEELAAPLATEPHGRWHEAFREAAREGLRDLAATEILILGLRLRYRMSQRHVAAILGVHEGTVSRQTSRLRDHLLDHIGRRLAADGWTGEDLSDLVAKEMGSLLLDEPALSAERLAILLGARGIRHADLIGRSPGGASPGQSAGDT